LGERAPQRSGETRDHLARRLLAPALNLGQILRRYPSPARRLRERLPLIQAEDTQPLAEHLPPERLLRQRLGRGWVWPGVSPRWRKPRVLRPSSAGRREPAPWRPLRPCAAPRPA